MTTYKIQLESYLEKKEFLFDYESTIIPMVGDRYAGRNFKDGKHRTVTSRLLIPAVPNTIIVYVEITKP